ncbi:copper chaperone PCu(A)C [Oceanobacter mangrovi]|uniref:copper chaperone PCu(A)C n=1 Tax=Oceanobacter mangrovi TaxID=2862510 RepID=UPI001C8D909B|nr:copper chaperone PCu(A)C [Oceanobacter mangrovi]
MQFSFSSHTSGLTLATFTARRFRWLILLVLFCCSTSQAHEYTLPGIRIAHPFAVETPPSAPTGAAYLDITNLSKQPLRLLSARSHVADQVEIHYMTMANGKMTMRAVDELNVAPAETLLMRPGSGYHLMLIGLQDQLRNGETFQLWLTFEGLDEFPVEVRIQTRDAGIAAADAHHQH